MCRIRGKTGVGYEARQEQRHTGTVQSNVLWVSPCGEGWCTIQPVSRCCMHAAPLCAGIQIPRAASKWLPPLQDKAEAKLAAMEARAEEQRR